MTNKTLYVLDAPVGTGKTTAIFKWMRAHPNKKYLYISPMLTEVEERVPSELEGLGFVFPSLEYDPLSGSSSKSFSLLKSLKQRRNISFSHALFTEMSKEHLKEIKDGGYTLVIDEEVSFISAYVGRYRRDDTITLINNGWIRVNEDDSGRVEWLNDNIEKDSQYYHFKEMCDMGQLFCSKGDRLMLVTQLPMELLTHSVETILVTYMFEHSVMYSFLKLRGVEFIPFQDVYPDVFLICDEQDWKDSVRDRINILSTPSTEKIKKRRWLSHVWYERNATPSQLKDVRDAIRSVWRVSDPEKVIYTMPKSASERTLPDGSRNRRCVLHRSMRAGDGYFLFSGARATNNYAHKTVAIHAYNRYVNLSVKAYLQDYGGEVCDDKFALAELIQWLWRTAIRRGGNIDVYFLSGRMEKLFLEWLNS